MQTFPAVRQIPVQVPQSMSPGDEIEVLDPQSSQNFRYTVPFRCPGSFMMQVPFGEVPFVVGTPVASATEAAQPFLTTTPTAWDTTSSATSAKVV